jgi:hypothetical protein
MRGFSRSVSLQSVWMQLVALRDTAAADQHRSLVGLSGNKGTCMPHFGQEPPSQCLTYR